eukprot:746042-Hanusia_phi.AAC.5
MEQTYRICQIDCPGREGCLPIPVLDPFGRKGLRLVTVSVPVQPFPQSCASSKVSAPSFLSETSKTKRLALKAS